MNIARKIVFWSWCFVCLVGSVVLLVSLAVMVQGATPDVTVAGVKNVAWNKLTPAQKKAVTDYELDNWHEQKMYVKVDKVVDAFKANPISAELTFAPLWEIQGVITRIDAGVLSHSIHIGAVRFTVRKHDPALEHVAVGTPVGVASTDCTETLGLIVCQGRAVVNSTEGYKMTDDEHAHVMRTLEEYLVIDAWNSDNVAGYSEGSSLYRRNFR